MIGFNLILKQFHKKLSYNIQTRTVENRILTITHQVEAIGIQFLDFAKNYSSKYEIPQILINPEIIESDDFLLGLNFITSLNGSVTIAKNHITLSKQVYSFPTNRYSQASEFARKHGGTGKLDFLKNSQDKETYRINKIENEAIHLLGNYLGQELEKGPNITLKLETSR